MTDAERDGLIREIHEHQLVQSAHCEHCVEQIKQLDRDVNGNGKAGLKADVAHLKHIKQVILWAGGVISAAVGSIGTVAIQYLWK